MTSLNDHHYFHLVTWSQPVIIPEQFIQDLKYQGKFCYPVLMKLVKELNRKLTIPSWFYYPPLPTCHRLIDYMSPGYSLSQRTQIMQVLFTLYTHQRRTCLARIKRDFWVDIGVYLNLHILWWSHGLMVTEWEFVESGI